MTRHAHTIRRFLEYQDEDRQFYLKQLLSFYTLLEGRVPLERSSPVFLARASLLPRAGGLRRCRTVRAAGTTPDPTLHAVRNVVRVGGERQMFCAPLLEGHSAFNSQLGHWDVGVGVGVGRSTGTLSAARCRRPGATQATTATGHHGLLSSLIISSPLLPSPLLFLFSSSRLFSFLILPSPTVST